MIEVLMDRLEPETWAQKSQCTSIRNVATLYRLLDTNNGCLVTCNLTLKLSIHPIYILFSGVHSGGFKHSFLRFGGLWDAQSEI